MTLPPGVGFHVGEGSAIHSLVLQVGRSRLQSTREIFMPVPLHTRMDATDGTKSLKTLLPFAAWTDLMHALPHTGVKLTLGDSIASGGLSISKLVHALAVHALAMQAIESASL